MLPFFSAKKARLFTTFTLSLAVMFGGLLGALTPVLSPVIGQNAQNTDIFTGQFIPAYLGSAYDPSEAYKQMAGLPVVVYAYDTYDKIINNYVYRTQIRADGSFQAAGLANASHYGVCVPLPDNETLKPFRPPIPGPDGDKLEAVFAFNSGLYPRTPTNPKNQLGQDEELSNINHGSFDDPNKQGCRTFFTSSRTVDIANHVNIFPLVPTTVLSVIIEDQIAQGGKLFDLYNINSPYEVYAQRITLNSVSSTNDSCLVNPGSTLSADCYSQSIKNELVNGPIIRGRSAPLIGKDATYQAATIFQAYAPKGVYAITFWRPDSRNIKTAVTYLTYSGSQPLNTPYNGIAFENVLQSGQDVVVGYDGTTKKTDKNQWKLATRDFLGHPEFAWQPKPGNLNIWGMTTVANNGTETPIGGATIKIGNSWFGFIDPMTRTCATGQSGKISAWGIFMFSSSCQPGFDQLPTTTTEISISSFEATIANSTLEYAAKENLSVTASGSNGPSKQQYSMLSLPKNGTEMNIYRRGYPIGPTAFNLTIDGKTFRRVATSEVGGRLIIPGVYFANNPSGKYYVSAARPGSSFGSTPTDVLSFVIDGTTLHNPQLALNTLGRVDIDIQQSTFSRVLAWFNFSSIYNLLRVSPVYAELWKSPVAIDNRKDVRLFLDMGTIDAISPTNYFTYGSYDLTQVEMRLPSQVADGDNNYIVFDRYGDDSNPKNGIITSSDDLQSAQVDPPAEAGANPRIVGVRLKEKDVNDHPLDAAFAAYQAFTKIKDTMPLNLRVTFQKSGVDLTQDEPADPAVEGQDPTQSSPLKLDADWEILLHKTGADGDGKNTYELIYEPISLMVRPPGCDYGSSHWYTFGANLNPKQLLCEGVGGVVNITSKAMSFIATNLTTVDPLQYTITRDGWNIMRNFINGMAVVLLLIAGIAIVLRYEPQWFNLQSVLTRLVTTILLINFSILIIQFAIDAANVFSTGGYYFLLNALTDPGAGTSMAGASAAVAGMAALAAYVFTIAIAFPGPALLAVMIGLLAVFIGLLYVLGKAMYFWILRQIILVICIIAAPIALAARVLPGTQSFYGRWKTMLTKTLISQIIFAFILALGMAMLRYATTGSGNFMTSLVGLGLAIGLFWYSTKMPAQAMSALEAGVGFAVGSNVKKAALDVRKRAKAASSIMAEKRILNKAKEKDLKVDKAGRKVILQNKLDAIDASTGFIGGSRIGKAARKATRKTVGRGTILAGTRGTKLKNAYDESIRSDSKIPGIGLMPSPLKGLGLAYRAATGMTTEDIEKIEEGARTKYVRNKNAAYMRNNPDLAQLRMQSALDESESKNDATNFAERYRLKPDNFQTTAPLINNSGNYNLHHHGTEPFVLARAGATPTPNQVAAERVIDKVLENSPSKGAVTDFKNHLRAHPVTNTNSYRAWRDSFRYGGATTSGDSWKSWWVDMGVNAGSLSAGSALSATNSLMLDRIATAADATFAQEIKIAANALSQNKVVTNVLT